MVVSPKVAVSGQKRRESSSSHHMLVSYKEATTRCGARLGDPDCNANSKLDDPEGLKLSRGQNRDLRRKLGLGEVWGRSGRWRYVRWLYPLRDRGRS